MYDINLLKFIERHEKKFRTVDTETTMIKMNAEKLPARKEQALFIFRQKNGKRLSNIIFNKLDNKNWQDSIWELLKPENTKIQLFKNTISQDE